MAGQALEARRFVRKTQLGPNEYRKNFFQLDADVISAVTSAEADRITPLMGKIYLRLVSAQPEFWEREGVLYFGAGDEGGQPVKASRVLYGLLGVASATAHKALQWMHEQGIIGYFAGKNGAGIRIFINRASSSIGVRVTTPGKKILPFARGSNDEARGSSAVPAFNDSFADSEVSDKDLNPRAPESGAETSREGYTSSTRQQSTRMSIRRLNTSEGREEPSLSADEVAKRLMLELVPSIGVATAQAVAREHERMRDWFETKGLPKVARVAQREAYNVLRKYRVITEGAVSRATRTNAGSVEPVESSTDKPRPLSTHEVEELAQACVAMLEVQGRPVESIISEMSAEAGGALQPEDASRVREKAAALLAVVAGS